MQIGMAKAMTAVGEHFGGGAGEGVVGEGEPATATEPHPVAAGAEGPSGLELEPQGQHQPAGAGGAEPPGAGGAEPPGGAGAEPPGPAAPQAPHTRLSQPGGLSATEGRQLADPRGALPPGVEGPVEAGVPSHPLARHGPGPDLTVDPEVAEVSLGPTEAQLEARVTTGEVRQSTQFLDRAQMETSIARNIEGNQPGINDWLATNPPEGVTQAFDYDPDMGNLGRGFRRPPGPRARPIVARPIAEPLTGVRVVLKSNGRGGYIIHTAHPIPAGQIRP